MLMERSIKFCWKQSKNKYMYILNLFTKRFWPSPVISFETSVKKLLINSIWLWFNWDTSRIVKSSICGKTFGEKFFKTEIFSYLNSKYDQTL